MESHEAQRAAKRYDDDGHGKDVGLRTAAACRCHYGGESASPTNEQTSNDKEKRLGKNARSSESCKDTERHCVISTC